MTWRAATEVEKTAGEPLSPELVLVSPDLRERALRELTFPHERNGTGPPAVHLLELAREQPEERDHVEVSLLRTAGDVVLHVAGIAVLFVLVVAGAAFGLTIAPGETEPRFATSPAPSRPSSPAIGTAAVSGSVSVDERAGGVDRWRRSFPLRLTTYGQLVWNLDALVRDVFGKRPVCLLHALHRLSPAACSASGQRRSVYRTTFDRAEGSGLRLRKTATAPRLRGRALPLSLGRKYVSCGPRRWVATTANRAFSCTWERPKPG